MESGGGRAGIQREVAGDGRGGGGWVLVEARLQGGAPWGFTLQGGLEHGEPLIISKVEEGGKADSLEQPLLVGDEIIIINDVELTGYRQEAIALVKGSYKTLQLTVRREFDPGYIKEFDASPPRLPTLPPSPPPFPSPPPPPPPPQQQQTTSSSQRSRTGSTGGVQLRIKNRRNEPSSRPHSWHSTKLGEGHQDSEQDRMDAVSNTWHHNYHTSASTTDLSGGFDSGGSYLRKSPDQYSSRGSMDSLDHPHLSQLHSGVQHHHPLGHHAGSGPHPAYSSCHQLSSARSSNSIDHLHSKRDSAYSSFSTSSSIPEYLASTPSFSPERSYSLETVPQKRGSGEMQQADLRYIQSVYDTHQSRPQEHERTSNALLHNCDSRGGGGTRPGVCYRSSSSSSSSGSSSGGMLASNRHSVGPVWGLAGNRSSYESLKGAPAPPRRSDSYAAIRNHERPNSWSNLEHARSLRSLPKSSWHHSSGPVASGAAKGSYGTEGGLHTVIEKSPESSPTIKPRQGGGFPQIPSPLESSTGPSGHASQTGRAILPTSVYPAPQPEPHYAQIPRRSIDEGVTEGQKNGTTTENGHPNNTPSSPYPHPSYSASSQLRTQAHEAERHQQEESNLAHYKPHQKPAGGRTDGQTRAQRPQNHLEPQSQSFQGSYVSKSQGPHSQVFQEQNHVPKIQSDPDFRSLSSHERRDPFTPVQSRGDRRTADQSSIHSDPVTYSRAAQGQAPPPHLPVHSQPQAPPTFTSQISSRHHSDHHWEHREQDKDKEHPLTRLEIALAEVQRCGDDNVVTASSHGSVMEKISRFERRDHGGKQRSHSTSNTHKGSLQRMTEKGRNVSCGADDLRTMLERSTNGTKAHRTLSYRASSSDHVKYRAPADPSSALQRSRSSFQLDKSRESDKDFPRRQEMLGPMQETSQNRSYKEAQSKVLRSTSFRRRDLNSAMSPPPPVPPPVYSSSSQQSPPVPAKYHSLEKKGPKTMPKPQGIIITPQPVISPHTPKERHVVSPEVRGPSPPALPNIPPVGPPAMMRICGRKRLTADQKKRSFSEPENMNEIGVSDSQTSALFRRGGENSVADRRKMFELAASRIGGGAPQNTASRPDLRQIQHDALTEYVERKRGVKGGQSSGQRPRSAYVQHDNSKHTVSSCYSDTYSLSSASSLLSLQESDLRNLPSNLLYPGRVTTPRPPAQPPQGACGSPTELQAQILEDFSRQSQSLSTHPGLHQQQQAAETHHNLGLSKQLSGALHRAGSGRSSGKSMSAEDLLEQSGERQITPQHYRSRSSPIMEMSNKDFSTSDVRMVGVYISEPGRCALAGDSRPADTQVPGPVSPQSSQNNQSSIHPAGLFQDTGSSNTPVTRRERQRNSERQRAQSTSTLAASVGLPCPFSPPGTQDGGGSEWQASDRLSLANLDAITFPDIPQTNASDGGKDAVNTTGINETMVMDRQTRHSFNDMLEDTEKDVYRDRAYSLEAKGAHSPQNAKQLSPVTPTPLSHSQLTVPSNRRGSTKTESSSSYPSMRHLSSLRISESSLYSISDQQQPLQTSTGLLEENFDEVFLQNPPPPSPPPPVKETSIIDDFPPPPPPIELEQETVHQSVQSCSSEFLNHTGISIRKSSLPQTPTSPTSSGFPLPAPSTITVEDSLEYEPLPKREKTSEELRVEALTRQLVLHDSSLLPLLDMWGVKSIVELMEEIFPNGRLVEKPLWQHRGSGQFDNSIQDGISDSTAALDQISLDEGEKDLNTRKVELCEALRSSLDALQQEKELLSEEQRHHQALGSSIEALVQERLRTNERDKYSMFIGDLERIVNLLLSLCSRLSRIDRALFALEREDPTQGDTAEEKDSLHHKRSLLLRQTEDAWELKENLDRRQRVVHAILSGYLTEPQLQDYRRYVSTKPSLLIRRRHLEELIRQGEDQLTRLTESLPAELAETHGWSKACPFILPNPAPCPSPFPKPLPQSVMPGPAHTVRSATVTSL